MGVGPLKTSCHVVRFVTGWPIVSIAICRRCPFTAVYSTAVRSLGWPTRRSDGLTMMRRETDDYYILSELPVEASNEILRIRKGSHVEARERANT